MKKRLINDRLSELPEAILLHILSFIDLKKAATTSVLSKKWQFLWIQLPVLEFCESSRDVEKTRDFVSWLNRTLFLRKGSINLEVFKVEFMYDERYSSDVNVWVRFAVRKNVKRLSLLLSSGEYTLPQVLYSHSSLTSLCLARCVVAPQSKIEWSCLTELTVWFVELPANVIGEILTGCPVLYKLALVGCWGFERLDLDSRSLHELELEVCEDFQSNQDLFEISAPFLRSFKVEFSPSYLKLRLVNAPSLVAADICYSDFNYSEEEMDTTIHIFEKIKHVKDFKVDSHCIYVLTNLVNAEYWRVPQTSWKSLTLDNAWRHEDVVEGILILLESSPNLETLLIQCLNPYEPKAKKGDPHARTWGTVAKDDLDCDLPQLKTVRLLDFAEPNLAWEPMLTMARILLKRGTSIENMEINAKGNLKRLTSRFAKMSETVLSYPRSSEKAIVVIDK